MSGAFCKSLTMLNLSTPHWSFWKSIIANTCCIKKQRETHSVSKIAELGKKIGSAGYKNAIKIELKRLKMNNI